MHTHMNTTQPATHTPYEVAKGSGMKSTWHSPDGWAKVEEFANGQAFLHSFAIAYPVQLTQARASSSKVPEPVSAIARANGQA